MEERHAADINQSLADIRLKNDDNQDKEGIEDVGEEPGEGIEPEMLGKGMYNLQADQANKYG